MKYIMPTVSVVIPVYPPHFDKLVESITNILDSTVMPDEIIIAPSEISEVNANNRFKELFVLCKQKHVPFIITSTTEQAYSGGNRNRGFIASCGDVVAFIDADDFTQSQKIEILKCIFEQNPNIKMLLHNSSSTKNILNTVYDISNIPVFKYVGDFNKKDIVKRGMDSICRGHATFARSVLNERLYDETVKHREDNIFTKKIHNAFGSSYFLPWSLFYYAESGIGQRNKHYADVDNAKKL